MASSSGGRRSGANRRVQWTFSIRVGPWFLLFWFLTMIAFAALSWWGENGLSKAVSLRAQRRALEHSNSRIQKNIERIKKDIRLVQEDPAYLEWLARERLGMMGENERVYLFHD